MSCSLSYSLRRCKTGFEFISSSRNQSFHKVELRAASNASFIPLSLFKTVVDISSKEALATFPDRDPETGIASSPILLPFGFPRNAEPSPSPIEGRYSGVRRILRRELLIFPSSRRTSPLVRGRSTAIPFGVNMNESGQIGAGLALKTRYRTID
jgi:hypothetical protein